MQASTIQIDATKLTEELAGFTGTLERTRHWTRRLLYTPGIEHLASKTGSWWLVDLIASRQQSRRLAGEEFQVWTLTVQPDRRARLVCDDGNGRRLLAKTIACTDFPLDGIAIWLAGGTLMLPSEY